MALTLGIDVAVRAAHQATLARDGKTVWRGRKFLTRPDELERVWADVGAQDPAQLTVVLEPTRNAWIVIAEWFGRRGAKVVMVPTTQSADLTAKDSVVHCLLGSLCVAAALTAPVDQQGGQQMSRQHRGAVRRGALPVRHHRGAGQARVLSRDHG